MRGVAASPSGSRAVAALAALAVIGAIGLLAIVLAWWGWRWFGPAATRFVPAGPQDPALALLASGLFAAPAGLPAAADTSARAAPGEARLLGVLAEEGGNGYGLFRLPAGPKLVAAGREISAGTVLVSVESDGVTVRDAGGQRRLVLRAGAAAPAAKTVAKAATGSAACLPPPGFKGDVLRLNAELVGGIVSQPDTWAALAVAEGGALAVRDDSGFSAMLAMQKGDRIEQANGIALRAPDDVVAAVLRPLAAGQSVRLVGSRGGIPREWLLQNAGTCR